MIWWALGAAVVAAVVAALVAVLVARNRAYGRHSAVRYPCESRAQRLRDWWAWRRAGGRR